MKLEELGKGIASVPVALHNKDDENENGAEQDELHSLEEQLKCLAIAKDTLECHGSLMKPKCALLVPVRILIGLSEHTS